ncbi:MAG: response regulator [Planctomycetes bacterium]|nr:response regulator [Planctomycetota bacterium]
MTSLRRRLGWTITAATVLSILAIEAVIFVPSYSRYREQLVATHGVRLEGAAGEADGALARGEGLDAALDALRTRFATDVLLLDAKDHELARAGEGRLRASTPTGYADDVLVSDLPLAEGRHALLREEHVGIARELLAFTLRIAGLVLIIAAVVSVVVLTIFRRRVLRPLARLTELATDEGTSPEDYRALAERPDEIGVLADRLATFGQRLVQSAAADAQRAALEQLVEERSRAAELMRSARDQAVEAARLKSEFLANMSHEIRTPIHGVLGMLTLLGDTTLDEEQVEFSETARNSAESLLAIVNDILDFSKIEAGRLEVESIPVDVQSMVEEITVLMAGRIAAKDLEISGYTEIDVPPLVLTDPMRLRQVLTNLLGNAIKFTAAGEVAVMVERDRGDPRGDVLRFTVRDTGTGIPKDRIDRLFQPFSQVDGSTTRRFGGTGLGLAISKRLVELMGGEIGVDSREGSGSAFWFTVRAPVAPSGVDLPGRRVPREDLRGARCLVVDDLETNRSILLRYAEAWGMTATAVVCGQDALDELRRAHERGEPYDLACVDMQMPGMNGLELVERVRGQSGLGDLRVVLLTSLGQLLPSERARAAGLDGQLSKPVRRDQLRDMFAVALGVDGERPAPARRSELSVLLSPETLDSVAGLRVLVVEDNPVNQQVALRTLQKLGVEVDVAGDGQQALDRIAETSYAVVLMDCHMPVLDGFCATERIRADERGTDRHLPVIAMTASAMEEDRRRCVESGMDAFLGKPVQPAQLLATVRDWCLRGRTHDTASS